MIDLISTHPSADKQTISCARLLAAVIAQAIDDASNKHANSVDQLAAIDWLFDTTSSFKQYATLIGVDAAAIRTALLSPPPQVETMHSKFDSSRRRHLRILYVKWLDRREAERKALEGSS